MPRNPSPPTPLLPRFSRPRPRDKVRSKMGGFAPLGITHSRGTGTVPVGARFGVLWVVAFTTVAARQLAQLTQAWPWTLCKSRRGKTRGVRQIVNVLLFAKPAS